jgi:hypothetical protein
MGVGARNFLQKYFLRITPMDFVANLRVHIARSSQASFCPRGRRHGPPQRWSPGHIATKQTSNKQRSDANGHARLLLVLFTPRSLSDHSASLKLNALRTTAASALAAIRARHAVKDQLQRKGEKVSHYGAKDITAMADEWLTEHRGELAEQCLAQARAMILSGALGKRAQAQLVTEYRKERTVAQLSKADGQQIAAEAQR